jgi:hypothetical protein
MKVVEQLRIIKCTSQADLENFWKVWSLIEEKYVSASSSKAVSHEERVKVQFKE